MIAQNPVSSEAIADPPPAGGLIFIEQLAADRCQTAGVPVLLGINHELRKAVFFRPRCKLWGCPVCAQINRNLVIFRADHGAKLLAAQGHHLDFLTLTSHEKLGPDASLKVFPNAWPKLRKRATRAAGGLLYFSVPERHKNGRLHAHLIVTAALPKKWWKDNARACGMGFQSDVKEVEWLGGVGRYIGKYLTKTIEDADWPKGHRRYRTSKAWPKLPELESDPAWEFEKLAQDASISGEMADLQRKGYQIGMFAHDTAWAFVEGKLELVEE